MACHEGSTSAYGGGRAALVVVPWYVRVNLLISSDEGFLAVHQVGGGGQEVTMT